jgi:cytidylate kinase
MTYPLRIAIDGPAASGKSTLGKRLADELGYLFFDTGVMYRAVTWAALSRQIPISDEAAVTALAETILIDVCPPAADSAALCEVLIDGQQVTDALRRPEVEANVSQVSAYVGVRAALTRQQRRIGQRGRVVMVGRDIGTVVMPDADLKIYLEASPEERARRRWLEEQAKGATTSYAQILATVQGRDAVDAGRVHAPLRAAPDAVRLPSDTLSSEEVLAQVLALVKGA